MNQSITKEMLKTLRNNIKVPYKELTISNDLSFIIFEVGDEPYYIKVES